MYNPFCLHSTFNIQHLTFSFSMDYKRLLTTVEQTLAQIESAGTRRLTIEQIADTIATNFRDELGITGGRPFQGAGGDTYAPVRGVGGAKHGPPGSLAAQYHQP